MGRVDADAPQHSSQQAQEIDRLRRRKIALEGQGTMAKLKPPSYPKPPRYLLVMLGSAVAFFIGATVYTYVWPDKPAVAEVPGDRLPQRCRSHPTSTT